MEPWARRQLEMDAKGICPDTGLDLWSCVDGPCDCWLPKHLIGTYIANRADELQAALAREAGDIE